MPSTQLTTPEAEVVENVESTEKVVKKPVVVEGGDVAPVDDEKSVDVDEPKETEEEEEEEEDDEEVGDEDVDETEEAEEETNGKEKAVDEGVEVAEPAKRKSASSEQIEAEISPKKLKTDSDKDEEVAAVDDDNSV